MQDRNFILAEIYIWLIWKQEGCWNVCDWTIGVRRLLFVCFQPIKIFHMFPVLSILRFLRMWKMYLHKIERTIKSRESLSPTEFKKPFLLRNYFFWVLLNPVLVFIVLESLMLPEYKILVLTKLTHNILYLQIINLKFI